MTVSTFLTATTLPASGTALTTANVIGSTLVTKGTGCTIAAANTHQLASTTITYAETVAVSGLSTTIRLPFPTTATTFKFEFYFYTGAAPSTASDATWTARSSSAVAFKGVLSTAGKLSIADTAGANIAGWAGPASASPETFPSNAWIRTAAYGTIGTSTTTGVLHLDFYTENSTTPINATPFSTTTANLGTTGLVAMDFGRSQTPAQAETWDYYGVQLSDASGSSYIGPYTPAANVAPTSTPANASVTITGSSTTVTATVADSDGTVTSAPWTIQSYNQSSAPTAGTTTYAPTLPAASSTASSTITGLSGPATVVVANTPTDNSSTTGTAGTTTIYVQGTPVTPSAVVSNAGAWVAVGAADHVSALRKTSNDDTKYIETPSIPSSARIILRVDPILPGDEVVTVRARYTGTGTTFTCQANLYAGSTLVTTATTPWVLTNAFADYTLTLSPTENANATNKIDTRIELIANQA